MKKNGMILSIARRLRLCLIIDLLLFIIIDLICWFGHYRTLEYYSNGLLFAGCLLLVIGFLSQVGGMGGRHDFGYQYLRSGSID